MEDKNELTPPEENKPTRAEDEKPEDNKTKVKNKWQGCVLYLRELSVVIIGILITLSITSLIGNYNKQNELKGMLTMVKEELIDNQERLIAVKNKWENEQHLFRLIRKNQNDITQIPTDTLNKYRFVIGSLYSFDFKNESYDVLQSSVYRQYIKERKLKYNLSSIYSSFATIDTQLNNYAEQKKTTLSPLLEELTDKELEDWLYGDNADKFFRIAIKNAEYRKFLITGGSMISPGYMEDVLNKLSALIREMGEYGY